MPRNNRKRIDLDRELIEEIRLIQDKVFKLTGNRISSRDALKLRMGAVSKTVTLFGKRRRMKFDLKDL